MTGEELYEALATAAAARRVPLCVFARPLFTHSSHLVQLRDAKRPTSATVARVRALIEGSSLPEPRTRRFEHRFLGERSREVSARQRRAVETARAAKERVALLRDLTHRARDERRAGEALGDCVRRLISEEGHGLRGSFNFDPNHPRTGRAGMMELAA